jgi:hypothetical protein
MAEPEQRFINEETESEEPESEHPDRPSDNPSVARCIRAWNRAYHKKLKELDEDEDDFEAEEAGKRSYLRAMPPLAGYENIRDFIACVTYAEVAELILPLNAARYLEGAKVALGALRHEAKPLRT